MCVKYIDTFLREEETTCCRAEIAEARSERDTQDQSAREFIDAYLRESIHLPAPRSWKPSALAAVRLPKDGGFLIAVRFDGREVFPVEPTNAREFQAGDWAEVSTESAVPHRR